MLVAYLASHHVGASITTEYETPGAADVSDQDGWLSGNAGFADVVMRTSITIYVSEVKTQTTWPRLQEGGLMGSWGTPAEFGGPSQLDQYIKKMGESGQSDGSPIEKRLAINGPLVAPLVSDSSKMISVDNSVNMGSDGTGVITYQVFSKPRTEP